MSCGQNANANNVCSLLQFRGRSLFCRYENLIQVRCLLEGVSTDDILNNWHSLLPEYMDKWNQGRKEVTTLVDTSQSFSNWQCIVLLQNPRALLGQVTNVTCSHPMTGDGRHRLSCTSQYI